MLPSEVALLAAGWPRYANREWIWVVEMRTECVGTCSRCFSFFESLVEVHCTTALIVSFLGSIRKQYREVSYPSTLTKNPHPSFPFSSLPPSLTKTIRVLGGVHQRRALRRAALPAALRRRGRAPRLPGSPPSPPGAPRRAPADELRAHGLARTGALAADRAERDPPRGRYGPDHPVPGHLGLDARVQGGRRQGARARGAWMTGCCPLWVVLTLRYDIDLQNHFISRGPLFFTIFCSLAERVGINSKHALLKSRSQSLKCVLGSPRCESAGSPSVPHLLLGPGPSPGARAQVRCGVHGQAPRLPL